LGKEKRKIFSKNNSAFAVISRLWKRKGIFSYGLHLWIEKYILLRNFLKIHLGGSMKRGIIFLTMVSTVLLVLAGCGKKEGEKEYFERAYQEMGKEQWSEAEKNFQKILDIYPNGEYASKAMFMVGFVNANYLKNYDKAKKYYTEFLEKYPNNELADDAKYELEHMGSDVDDLPFLKEEGAKDSVVASNSQKSAVRQQ